MFEDRSKNYSFEKIDSAARTTVSTLNASETKNMTEAQKRLFSNEVSKPILQPHTNIEVENLPSSKYLQSFNKNLTVGEAIEAEKMQSQENKVEEKVSAQTEQKQESNINFDKLIEESQEIKVDEKIINKELKKINPTPKKNYSFRIKLVAGVYCILVALFGGWVISNAVNISRTNASVYETVSKTKEVDANIESIILKIKKYDDASKDPEDSSVLKEMITTTIETTPETITEPNEYVEKSNWFDAFCNWISRLFGGK